MTQVETMTAAVMAAPGEIRLQHAPRPVPSAGELRIRLEGSGVCGSNLPVWQGQPWFQYPFAPGAPGHEGWGRIDALGPETDGFEVGERVTFLSGHAFAEFDVAKASAVVRLPDALDGQPFPGEPLACAVNVFRRSDVRAGDAVAVVGVGFIGALVIQLAKHAGAHVVALSRRPWALEVARRCGAEATFETGDFWDAVRRARALTNDAAFARVIECGGEQVTLDLATQLTSEGGRLVIAGYHQVGARQVDMQLWNWRGLDVINAHERDMAVVERGLRESVDAVMDGRLDPFPLLTHSVPLARMGEAFGALDARPDGFLKAVVTA
jgi:threonine dehydrogenase-like Zn-dependent dehydrogenase